MSKWNSLKLEFWLQISKHWLVKGDICICILYLYLWSATRTDLAHGNVKGGLCLSESRWHVHAVDVAATNVDDHGDCDDDEEEDDGDSDDDDDDDDDN